MTQHEPTHGNESAPGPDGLGRSLRAHDRFEWNEGCEACWFVQGQPTEPEVLKCVDLGLGGVGLISPSPVAVGTRGAVLLLCDGQIGRIRDIEVVHSRFDPSLQAHVIGGKWLAGTACADRLIVTRASRGAQLAIRPANQGDSRRLGAA